MKEIVVETKVETDEISLKDLFRKLHSLYSYLRSKSFIILVFSVLGAILGFTYTWLYKPVYIATTTFVLEEDDKGGGLGQYAGIASMVGIDIAGSRGSGIFQSNNILELYKSRTMIEKTLLTEIEVEGKKELLIDRYIGFNKLRRNWAKNIALKDVRFDTKLPFTRVQDSILGTIVSNINLNLLDINKLDKETSIIKVEVKTQDEFFSKSFNDQLVENVNEFYVQTKTKKSLENIAILQQKTDSVRAVMNGAIYSGAAAMDATPNLNPTRQVQRTVPSQRSQFTAETNKIILGELVKNLEMSKIALHREKPLIQVIDQPIFPLEKKVIGKIKGIILGGIATSLFIVLLLTFKRMFKSVIS